MPLALVATICFALVHLLTRYFRRLTELPRSVWLSIAGGVSVAYVFVALLPETEEHARRLEQSGIVSEQWLERLGHPIYLLALVGVLVFYGVERLARQGRSAKDLPEEVDSVPGLEKPDAAGHINGHEEPTGIFWVHVGTFTLYNALIGWLLTDEEEFGYLSLGLYTLAMCLHLLVNDVGLRLHHRQLYDRYGRWLMAAAPIAGFALGYFAVLPAAVISGMFGFLCGATVLNTLKEELPEESDSRFWAFAGAAIAFSGLLIVAA